MDRTTKNQDKSKKKPYKLANQQLSLFEPPIIELPLVVPDDDKSS